MRSRVARSSSAPAVRALRVIVRLPPASNLWPKISAGFEGYVQVSSYDDDIQVEYTLTGGTLHADVLTLKKAADADPAEIFGHKFDAGGSLTITRKALTAGAEELLATLERMQEETYRSVEQALGSAGWMMYVNGESFEPGHLGSVPGRMPSKPKRPRDGDVIELSPGPFGMFSGRWRESDAGHLAELAKAGFEGGITITGEEGLEVEYTLSGGTVTAKACVMEFMDDEALEDEASPSP